MRRGSSESLSPSRANGSLSVSEGLAFSLRLRLTLLTGSVAGTNIALLLVAALDEVAFVKVRVEAVFQVEVRTEPSIQGKYGNGVTLEC